MEKTVCIYKQTNQQLTKDLNAAQAAQSLIGENKDLQNINVQIKNEITETKKRYDTLDCKYIKLSKEKCEIDKQNTALQDAVSRYSSIIATLTQNQTMEVHQLDNLNNTTQDIIDKQQQQPRAPDLHSNPDH